MSEQTGSEVRIRPDVEKYTHGVSGSGAKTMHKGDTVGVGLNGMTLDEVKEVASAMGFEEVDKYDHLNVGQRRMNLGNRIRGIIQRANKEKDGSGDALFAKCIKTNRKLADQRIAEATKKKAAAAKKAD